MFNFFRASDPTRQRMSPSDSAYSPDNKLNDFANSSGNVSNVYDAAR